MSKKIIFFIFAAFIAATFTFCSGEKKSAEKSDMSGKVQWESLAKGLERSKNEGKPLIIYFYTDWCTYCKQMESEIFRDREITDWMNKHYVSAKVNPEKETEKITIMGDKITPMELMRYMEGKGFPSTVFWDKNGKPVTTFPGYMPRDVFLPLIKYMQEECYNQDIQLDDYINGTARCEVPEKA
jgi:thioredoxin-related protein